jgi:hypothetical protein
MTNLSKRLADSLVAANNGDANLVNKSTLTKCVLILASVSGLILWATAPAAAAPLLSNTATDIPPITAMATGRMPMFTDTATRHTLTATPPIATGTTPTLTCPGTKGAAIPHQ